MYIDAKFDSEGSKLAQKLTFVCNDFEFKKEFIDELKKDKLLKFADSDSLPETITCQIIIYYQDLWSIKIIFFNPDIPFPSKIYDEPLLNKELINWDDQNWFFWVEINVPIDYKWINLNFQMDI